MVAGNYGKAGKELWRSRQRIMTKHNIDPAQHEVGKEQTQKIESKHINLRTRIKRLVRRTICFSKTTTMHDLVIGLFINRYEFGVVI